jgi:endonuclease YncB( thermonuclease family)
MNHRGNPMPETSNIYVIFGAIIVLILVMLMLGSASNAFGRYVNAHGVEVIDGDTVAKIERGKRTSYRMHGVDAPETDQIGTDAQGKVYNVGIMATQHLRALIGNRPIEVVLTGGVTYNRPVARLYVDGQDLGAAMVRDGWAVDVRKHSGGEYRQLQEVAKAAGLGMWRYDVAHPAAHRAQRRPALN